MNKLIIGGREFSSRLFVGTGKFSSNELMEKAIEASGSEMITVAMKRINMTQEATDDMLTHIDRNRVQFLPNTSGVRNAEEAVLAAQFSRECFGTDFVKLEIHPDPKYLLPDPVETLKATEQLAKLGFVVLPYIQADPVLCKRLEEVGAATVMPLGAPIGTNKGLRTRDFLQIIIEQSNVPVIVECWDRRTFPCRRSYGTGSRCCVGKYGYRRRRESRRNGYRIQTGCRSRPPGIRSRIRRTIPFCTSQQPVNLFLRLNAKVIWTQKK